MPHGESEMSRGSRSARDKVETLLQRFAQGDKEAFAELFQIYREQIKDRLELRLGAELRRKVDASDIMQEAYLSATRHLGEFRGDTPESFIQWLTVIASRRMTDVCRRYLAYEKRDIRREVNETADEAGEGLEGLLALLPDGTVGPAVRVSIEELRRNVRAAIEQLPEHYRMVIELRYFEGLKLDEIARRLGKTKGAVAMLLSRAAEKLRTILGEVSVA